MTINSRSTFGAGGRRQQARENKDEQWRSRVSTGLLRLAIVLALAVHVFLLGFQAEHDSAAWDEVGHFAAAWSYARFGTFGLYRVNPPLVRLIAGIPLRWMVKTDVDFNQYRYPASPADRTEFGLGSRLATEMGPDYFWCLTVARFICIPLSLLGAWICYLWAYDLYGHRGAVFVLLIWCFDPIILAYGHLITPDMGATSLGLAAAYLFWKWLRRPSWKAALAAGVVLGLAELSKTTWVILFVLWPVMWLIYRRFSNNQDEERPNVPGRQLALILVCGIYMINLGYGFEGTFTRLGDYEFVSRLFSGRSEATGIGNRWAGTALGRVPVPLPAFYLSGIDVQRRDFEQRSLSFLNGEWRVGGWWYYYIYALLIKEPLGTVLLVVFATALYPLQKYARGMDELIVFSPGAAILLAVSSQTGFNHHVRYVMPALPFFYILIGRLVGPRTTRNVKIMSAAALAISIGSSLLIFPHSLSYFSVLIGGPKYGNRHLANSNTDWGQDLFYLKQWLGSHPMQRPIHLAYDLPLIDPRIVGIEYERVPVGPIAGVTHGQPDLLGPLPGIYIVSVNQLSRIGGSYAYFDRFTPVDRIGYTMNVYEISLDEANAARRELGLPPVPGG